MNHHSQSMGASASLQESGWTAIYNQIKCRHDAAFLAIQNAITLEEQEKSEEALEKYLQGISFIDSALRIQVTCPENPDLSWEKAVVMIQKMKKTRAEVLTRIHTIQQANEVFEPPEAPPSYDEAVGNTPPSTPQTYNDLAAALNQLSVVDGIPMEAGVVFIYDEVKLFFISSNGEVSSTMKPQTLSITLVENEGENVPRAILQVGDLIYPLIPGVSPCYRSDFGAFILPNVYAEYPGSSIGLILPSDADPSAYELLESVLYGIVGQAKPPKEIISSEDLSGKISNGIVTGASYLSRGLIFGAEKLGTLITDSTPKLINRIDGADRPADISPNVQKGMQIAETATNKAAQVTGFVAEKVGIATVKLGQFLAPHIQKQGTRLLTSGFRMSEENASAKMKGVLTVAAGAVEGFSTVYYGLENSASILGRSLKDNTVKVVKHKYGQPAGEVAGDTLNTMGNVYYISHNVKIIHPKHFAKRTAKEAGKAFIYNSVNDGASTSRATQLNGTYSVDNTQKMPFNDEKK